MADGIQTGVAYSDSRAPKHLAAVLHDMAAWSMVRQSFQRVRGRA